MVRSWAPTVRGGGTEGRARDAGFFSPYSGTMVPVDIGRNCHAKWRIETILPLRAGHRFPDGRNLVLTKRDYDPRTVFGRLVREESVAKPTQ